VKPLMVAAATEATDDQLVAAAQQGSDVAFEALFRRYRDRITGYVRGIVSDHARAEDIVQDTFFSALRSLRATDREVVFKPWVYEIAKNACIDQLRKARRASEVSIDSEDFSPGDEGRLSAGVTSTDAAYAAREQMDALTMAFNDLPEAQREVLVSRELEGLSYDKISSNTGLSRSAVESMLFRARRTLKDGFDDISTGERCQRMRTVLVHLTDGRIGLRQERRLVRHLNDCAACRREAVALGHDHLVVGAPSRAKAALSRVAGFLPLPAFLKRRFGDGAGLLGSGGQGAAEGASLAGKAAAVLAAAAIAGGGAGVAHKAGVIGDGGGSKAAAPATGQDPSTTPTGPSSSGGGGGGAGRPSKTARGGDGPAGARQPGGSSQAGRGGAAGQTGAVGGAAGIVGGGLGGVGGKAGSLGGGNLGGAAGGVTKGAGGTIGETVNGLTGTVDNTVKGVTGGLDNTVKGVSGTLNGTINGVSGTLTGTVNGVTGSPAPSPKPASPAPSLPVLPQVLPGGGQAPVTVPQVRLPGLKP
jgi:RNA polymerase sigma factor (sigma-70 family)